jgi:hypothetical protein
MMIFSWFEKVGVNSWGGENMAISEIYWRKLGYFLGLLSGIF